jgi:precorrin-6B methylase 2
MGRLLRTLRVPFAFSALGRTFYFNPECAAAYGTLIGGRSNEPETIVFLTKLLSTLPTQSVTFVDVGASVGEFAVYAAGISQISAVVAVEPQADSCKAIQESAKLNGFTHLDVINCAASNATGTAHFQISRQSPTAAHISAEASPCSEVVSHCCPV